MKIIIIINIFLFIITFLSCNGHNKTKINLIGFKDSSEVIYVTERAKFSFGKYDLIDYCTKKNTGEGNTFIYKQTLEYIKQFKGNPIIISDTLGTIMVPDSTVPLLYESDSLVRVRNQNSPYSWVTVAIECTLFEFAKYGKIKVYDLYERKFADFIFLDKVKTNNSCVINVLLPNDSIVFSRLLWIR